MAELKQGFFAKTVQKHAGRAKEKLRQNLGKADRTTDEAFEEYLIKFKRQENQAIRLHKEVKNYVVCVKAMQNACKSLFEVIQEHHEPEWAGKEQLIGKAQVSYILWNEFAAKINDEVVLPVDTYFKQFGEIKKKIEKRGRKLVDYDGCRHAFEAMQNTKKPEEVKLSKSREQLEDAGSLYKALNLELCEELPALYDSRIPFYINCFQALFNNERKFHLELASVNTLLSDNLELLGDEYHKGTYKLRRLHNANGNDSFSDDNNSAAPSPTDEIGTNNEAINDSPTPPEHNNTKLSEVFDVVTPEDMDNHSDSKQTYSTPASSPSATLNKDTAEAVELKADPPPNVQCPKRSPHHSTNTGEGVSNANAVEEVKHTVVLYKVKATFKYVAEDCDELSFEPGELISVIPYDDPEEQEEGWLTGIKDADGKKGLFPANFTTRVES